MNTKFVLRALVKEDNIQYKSIFGETNYRYYCSISEGLTRLIDNAMFYEYERHIKPEVINIVKAMPNVIEVDIIPVFVYITPLVKMVPPEWILHRK